MAKIDQRYQASFTLTAKVGKGGDLVRGIQMIIFEWIKRSERRLYGREGCHLKRDFYEGSKSYSARPHVSSVVTSSYYGDREAAWCMRYTHDDSEMRGVDWVTECGLRFDRANDTIVMSIMLTTSTTGEVLLKMEERPEWRVSVPGFVRTVLQHEMIESVSIADIGMLHSADLVDEKRKYLGPHPWLNWVKTEGAAKKSEILLTILNGVLPSRSLWGSHPKRRMRHLHLRQVCVASRMFVWLSMTGRFSSILMASTSLSIVFVCFFRFIERRT